MILTYLWPRNKIKVIKFGMYELLDPRQGYNHVKFERPPLSSVRQKAKAKVFVFQVKKLDMCKSENKKIILYLHT